MDHAAFAALVLCGLIPWGYWTDYGHVFGPRATYLVGTQLAGAVIGVRGSASAKAGVLAYDLFAGTPIYKPSGFPTARVTLGFQLTAQF